MPAAKSTPVPVCPWRQRSCRLGANARHSEMRARQKKGRDTCRAEGEKTTRARLVDVGEGFHPLPLCGTSGAPSLLGRESSARPFAHSRHLWCRTWQTATGEHSSPLQISLQHKAEHCHSEGVKRLKNLCITITAELLLCVRKIKQRFLSLTAIGMTYATVYGISKQKGGICLPLMFIIPLFLYCQLCFPVKL